MTDILHQRAPLESNATGAGDDRATTRRDTITTLVVGALLAIVVLGVAVQHAWMPYPSDQTNYLRGAQQFPHPGDTVFEHQYLRFGLTLPMRLAIELFGYSEAAYYAVPAFTVLLLTLSVYALGCLLFSRTVGVAAAVLSAGNSLVFHLLLQPLPDVLSTALFCAALAVTIAIRQGRPAVSATRRRQIAALLAVGALLGWSYLTREYIVFAWPLVPVLLARRVGWRGLLWVAVPLALVGVMELALGAIAYGDPLVRFRVTSGHGSGERTAEVAATFRNKPRWWYLTRLTNGIEATPEHDWLLGLLAATVVGGLLLRRRLGLFLGWLAMVYVPLVLLGGFLNPAYPSLRLFKMRYWFPVLPAIILGGLGTTWLLARFVAERLPPFRRRAGVLAGIAVLGLTMATLKPAYTKWDNTQRRRAAVVTLRDFRGWLRDNHSDVQTIWTDRRSAHLLPIYATGTFGGNVWDGPFRRLTPRARPQPGDHVVMFSTQAGRTACSHCKAEMQKALGKGLVVPANWKLVFFTPKQDLLVYSVT